MTTSSSPNPSLLLTRTQAYSQPQRLLREWRESFSQAQESFLWLSQPQLGDSHPVGRILCLSANGDRVRDDMNMALEERPTSTRAQARNAQRGLGQPRAAAGPGWPWVALGVPDRASLWALPFLLESGFRPLRPSPTFTGQTNNQDLH